MSRYTEIVEDFTKHVGLMEGKKGESIAFMHVFLDGFRAHMDWPMDQFIANYDFREGGEFGVACTLVLMMPPETTPGYTCLTIDMHVERQIGREDVFDLTVGDEITTRMLGLKSDRPEVREEIYEKLALWLHDQIRLMFGAPAQQAA